MNKHTAGPWGASQTADGSQESGKPGVGWPCRVCGARTTFTADYHAHDWVCMRCWAWFTVTVYKLGWKWGRV